MAAMTALGLAASGEAEIITQLERAPSGHLLTQVQIGTNGPYTFVLDTGASNTAIIQPVAETLGFSSVWQDYDDVQSLTALFSAERFELQDVRVADLPAISLNTVVIPVDDTETQPVAGLLGADAIPATHYRIDFANASLVLDAPPPEHADGQVGAQNLLFGRVELARGLRDVRVMIDSGSAQTLVNDRLRTQLRDRIGGYTVNIHGVESRVARDPGAESRPVRLSNLRLGGLCLNWIIALRADLDIFEALEWNEVPAMVIGMDVLQYATVTVDREAGTFEISASDEDDACPGGRAAPRAREHANRR